MAAVLLTVSGTIPPDIEVQVQQGQRPCPDYLALARAMGATLLDYVAARRMTGWLGRALERLGGSNLMLAWACFIQRRNYAVIFTDGEQVGIPLAVLLKFLGWLLPGQTQHLMIAHILSVGKKLIFFDWLRIQSHIQQFFVYSTWQKRFIETRLQVPPERVIFTPFMVDAQFFSPTPAHVQPQRTQTVCAVGIERRDYPTLLQAVRGLDVQVVVAAASPWSKQANSMQGLGIPPNVSVRRFSQFDLRQLYADCAFMVMPLYEVEFQAGVTAILEAMSMQRAVICSRTRGQTDVVVDGDNGLYVPPGDANALRQAILALLDQPHEAARMGQQGRALIEHEMSLDCYVQRLSAFVRAAMHANPTGNKTPDKAIVGINNKAGVA
jgi:glycosyltransferase involved in cell wall biosynthesis